MPLYGQTFHLYSLQRNEWFYSYPILIRIRAPYHINQYISVQRLNLILAVFCYADEETPMKSNNDFSQFGSFFVHGTFTWRLTSSLIVFVNWMSWWCCGWTSTPVQVGLWCYGSHTHLGMIGTPFSVLSVGYFSTWSLTCSSPRRAVRSHSLVCSENSLFIVGIGPILIKELELIFRSDRSDRMCVYS